VDLRAGPDDLEKRKFLTLPGLELRPSVVQPVSSRYTDYAIPAPFKIWSDHIITNCAEEGKMDLKWQVFKYPNEMHIKCL
jgi:hypothetical protein